MTGEYFDEIHDHYLEIERVQRHNRSLMVRFGLREALAMPVRERDLFIAMISGRTPEAWRP